MLLLIYLIIIMIEMDQGMAANAKNHIFVRIVTLFIENLINPKQTDFIGSLPTFHIIKSH